MLSKKVFHGVLRDSLSSTQRKKAIRSHVIMRQKFKAGKYDQVKARLVAGGDGQDVSLLSPDKISSPTVATSSVFSIIAIAAAKGHHVLTFDVGTAYLNADMTDEVYVYLDPTCSAILAQIDASYSQYILTDGRMLVKLNKALYGCVQSAKLWYEHLKSVLLGLGYTCNAKDICVFNRVNSDGSLSTVCFHVDDCLATSPNLDDLKSLAAGMKSAFGDVEFHWGKVHEYLGMKLDFTTPKQCHITMEKYIVDAVGDFDIGDKTSLTPASTDLFYVDKSSSKLSEELRKKFHSGTAKLLYLATRARPDILCAIIFLCKRVQVATVQDAKKLVRVVRYLNGTRELGMVLGGDCNGDILLTVYTDASYGVHDNGKSHSGIYITLGRGPVLAKSNSQSTVTKSSAEAELVTLSDGTSLGVHQRDFNATLGIKGQGKLMEDNMSAINLARNGRSNSSRTRHIHIRYFFVKQYLDNGDFELLHCPTELMIADILTKPLQGDLFLRLRSLLLGYSIP